MATTADIRNNLKIEIDGEPWMVLEFLHHKKPGRGGAVVRTKLKNLITGAVMDKTFQAGEKIELANLETKNMQFLYKDGEAFCLMDNQTYEQILLSEEVIGESAKYLVENVQVQVMFFHDKPVVVEPPLFVELRVSETMPGSKTDQAQGGGKPATLETGLVVTVPPFISEGDIVKIDTRSDTYIERVS